MSTSIGPGITVWTRLLQFDRKSVCSFLVLSSYSCLVLLLATASVARDSKSYPNSPSLNFAMSTVVVDPSWLRWITVDVSSLWWSFLFLSFLFLLCLCWSTCCSFYGSASGLFLGV